MVFRRLRSRGRTAARCDARRLVSRETATRVDGAGVGPLRLVSPLGPGTPPSAAGLSLAEYDLVPERQCVGDFAAVVLPPPTRRSPPANLVFLAVGSSAGPF